VLPTGYTEYLIAGCRLLPAAGKEIRFIMHLTVRRTPEGLRVWGDSWGMPWTQMHDKCPV
jgi:hypothetical protein